ncbi:MAG: DnaA/Hda family protein [Rhodobacteraceae bacterium]|jgi:chromosomal replication initiation ATPase DnaA|nr:DnaA/Hda family protein [Paracoccaceae bacterium]
MTATGPVAEPRQLAFDLPVRPALGRSDFFVSPANAAAVAATEAALWPNGRLVIAGETGAGKTHLAHVWAARAGAAVHGARDPGAGPAPVLVVEDIDTVAGDAAAEEALFHRLNAVAGTGGRVLMTARAAPARIGWALPDLGSRLAASGLARIDRPDDALLSAVLLKLFADRQLAVAPEVIALLVTRMPRSLAAAGDIVAALDAASLAEGRAITRPFAGAVMDRLASPPRPLE